MNHISNPLAPIVPDSMDRPTISVTEDQRFFAFARENILILLALGSVPALSHVLGILPAPGRGNLSLIASMMCLVVFWAALSLKGPIRECLVEDTIISPISDRQGTFRKWWRGRWWIPFSFVVISLFAGSWLIACYLAADANLVHSVKDGQLTVPASSVHIWTYLSIYPLLVAGIAVLIVMRFCLLDAVEAQDIIREKLASRSEEIVTLLKDYAEFTRLSRQRTGQDQPLRKIGDELLRDAEAFIHDLAKARIEVTKSYAIRVQMLLLSNFSQSFWAVSDRDIGFWHDPDEMAKDYFKLNVDAINRGTPVSRMFILASEDFFYQEGPVRGTLNEAYLMQTVDVLASHEIHKMGWAIAIHDHLDIELRDRHHRTLDFGLFRGEFGEATSYFRDHREPIRKLSVVFDVAEKNHREIEINRNTFRDLVRHAWVYNEYFLQNLQSSGLLPESTNRSAANGQWPFVEVSSTRAFLEGGLTIRSIESHRLPATSGQPPDGQAQNGDAQNARAFPFYFASSQGVDRELIRSRIKAQLELLVEILHELRNLHPASTEPTLNPRETS